MNTLLDFCEVADIRLKMLSGEARIDYFFKLRYHDMSRFFPHRAFSVEFAEFDFFRRTADILSGKESMPELRQSEYYDNWVNWLKLNQRKIV